MIRLDSGARGFEAGQKGNLSPALSGWRGVTCQREPKELGGQRKMHKLGMERNT